MTGFLIWAGSLLIGVFAAYLTGRSSKTTKDAQSRADTLERAIHADTGTTDGSTDLDWLRKRGKR
jgi:hypothetical protein